jgi:hypothetical protein
VEKSDKFSLALISTASPTIASRHDHGFPAGDEKASKTSQISPSMRATRRMRLRVR